ncbi:MULTISPECIES: cell division protein ZapB [Vibrio]|jgi:cell division protein ZapB|uniref:Cell division protein ZapB n=3 Tax=Vibrio cyclitrophicus TaxID=47951 RepID=A0A7Z1S3A9_9VIBR|nr:MULTISPECIES: cell division protein ZapB [Vibrio]KNH14891.1 septal ring assembly protein ZapB [Vibrio lentus]MBY7661658.1 cell division protein ZapB [Vibrio atlanticus]ERM58877.1 putative cytoplasmic protein [Vibrio cyclitrophicus FF75]KAA8598387.1 Cell division protein ZapB [Vibrio cyclitrophicus]MBE8555351.1 cell division protein ZapB [Vibrio sp. OPT24]|tara:strand:+ start:551 stop:793 length:243 start_codon:yes stop_codon:yes gene_type:complete
MSFEVLEQLEAKIQTAVDTIALLQMEVEELKEEKQALATEASELKASRHELEQKTQQMQEEHSAWQDRIRNLLGKMDDVE